MPAFISMKKLIIFLFGGLVCAAGVAFLVNFLLAGPKLGPVYDFFIECRPPPPISREILIINTDEFVESGDIFNVLMTLTELDAAELVLTARISGSSSPLSGSEAEIRRRFFDEYVLLENNIRNLFEAIRTGSVPPSQAPLYVQRLVELSENSRDRLLSGLIDRDEDLLRSAAVFGSYLEVFTKPVIDGDGKIRRVNPVETESSVEHPVYHSLKRRYADTHIEDTPQGQILFFRDHEDNEFGIPLDRDGNILTAGQGGGFRGLDLKVFRDYEEAQREMRRVMKEADELGAFSKTAPEKAPLLLEDYALVLRDEMLKAPDGDKRAAWVQARNAFFESLNDFLSGPAEAALVRGYEEVIAAESSLNERGIAKLTGMRDEMIKAFSLMREKHNELAALHSLLQNDLGSSFCVMGPAANGEYCALLANVMITGSHIRPAYDRYALYWSIAAVFVMLLIIFRMRPAVLLFAGLGLCALTAAIFGWVFIFTAYWIDPTIVFCSSITGAYIIFCCKCVTLGHRARRFRAAYGVSVPPDVLRELISLGRPKVGETVVNYAAVIAIRDFNLLGREDREKGKDAGRARRMFSSAVKEKVFGSGAIIAGFEGDTILVCFGSPLEKTGSVYDDPVNRAYSLVEDLLLSEKVSWRFGIDSGECTFYWSPETGYTVNGRPAVRAKILASKTARFKVRALITDSVREKNILNVKKIGALSGESDSFYELSGNSGLVQERASSGF